MSNLVHQSCDFTRKFLPDGLTKVGRLPFLTDDERRLMSQVQGRTYANMFALLDKELGHREVFRRLETMVAPGMPAGYAFLPRPDDVAHALRGASTWAVLALTCDIELFSQAHYRSSLEPDPDLDALWRDVFLFHWKEESQHANLDERAWVREDARLDAQQRDRAVDELIGLVGAVDGIATMQAEADAAYFVRVAGRSFDAEQTEVIQATLIAAYRWQYVATGVQHPRFLAVLGTMIDAAQAARINAALAPILAPAI